MVLFSEPAQAMRTALLVSAFLLAFALSPVLRAAVTTTTCGMQQDVPESERLDNTVKWTTASEQDNFGYDVYRGTSEDGPFQRINERTIPGHGTTDETHSYSYRDSAIDPCQTYWYYVESISTESVRERFTPIFRAPPKAGPSAAPASATSSG